MNLLSEIVNQNAEVGIISALGAGIASLTTAVGYLWRRIEKELDECKADRIKLWSALAKLGYSEEQEESK